MRSQKGNTVIDLSLAYRRLTDVRLPDHLYRQLSGASIRTVAREAGLAKESVHQIARNKGDPKLSTLIAIADAFGITVVDFLKLGMATATKSDSADRTADTGKTVKGRNRKG